MRSNVAGFDGSLHFRNGIIVVEFTHFSNNPTTFFAAVRLSYKKLWLPFFDISTSCVRCPVLPGATSVPWAEAVRDAFIALSSHRSSTGFQPQFYAVLYPGTAVRMPVCLDFDF